MKRKEIEVGGTYKSGSKIVLITEIADNIIEFQVVSNRRNKLSIGSMHRVKFFSFQSNYWRIDWNINEFIMKNDFW